MQVQIEETQFNQCSKLEVLHDSKDRKAIQKFKKGHVTQVMRLP